MESSPHILLLPLPFQGHIMPLMEIGHRLIDSGFTVTFLVNKSTHSRLLAATGYDNFTGSCRFHLIGISDGLNSDEERNDQGIFSKLVPEGMSPGIESVIRETALKGRPIKWILADHSMAWAFPLAKQMGLRAAVFWIASAAMLAFMLNIPQLIQSRVDYCGLEKEDEIFKLAVGMPTIRASQMPWNIAEKYSDKCDFFSFILNNNRATREQAEFMICNTFMDVETEAISLLVFPTVIPIGPLISAEHHPVGHMWAPANSSAIFNWLDKRSLGSVIYVAFGSHAKFDKAQLEELVHGLEMTARPFLWAVKLDLGMGQSNEFLRSLVRGENGLLVEWVPQQQVLAHSSIGCFVTHCGWNSTMEGVRNGVRFLCWPFFIDHFLNQSYICDMWKIGVRVGPDDDGVKVSIIKRENIRERVEEVMKDDDMKERALMWKERAINSLKESGSSYENYKRIVDIMKLSA